jgi:hypothetical protein
MEIHPPEGSSRQRTERSHSVQERVLEADRALGCHRYENARSLRHA